MQVLHIDRNNYYGGQSASLNLNQVCTPSLCTACSFLLLLCMIYRLQPASPLLQLPVASHFNPQMHLSCFVSDATSSKALASCAAMHCALCVHECHQ